MNGAIIVDELKELAARQVKASPHNACEAAVADVDHVALTAFSLEFEPYRCAFYIDVLVSHRGEPIRMIFLGVFLIADTDECGFEEAHDGGEDFFARQIAQSEIALDAFADDRQSLAEEAHALILVFIPRLAPAGMIAALLPKAFGIAAGGLEAARSCGGRSIRLSMRAGWPATLMRPDDFLIANGLTVRIEVLEAFCPAGGG